MNGVVPDIASDVWAEYAIIKSTVVDGFDLEGRVAGGPENDDRQRFALAPAYPTAEQMDAPLFFASLARIGRVHVEAIGTVIELGGTDLDQFQQAPFLYLDRQIVPGFERGPPTA